MKHNMKNSILFLSVFMLLFSCTTQEEKVREYVEQNVLPQAEEYLICQAIIKYMKTDAENVFTDKFTYYAKNPNYDLSPIEEGIATAFNSIYDFINENIEKRRNAYSELYTMLSNEDNIKYQMHQIDSTLTFKKITMETSIYSIDDIADIYFKPHHLKYTEITPQLYRNIYRSMLCLGAKTYKYDVVDEIRIKEKKENVWTVDLVYHSGYCMPLKIGYNKETGFYVSEAPWLQRLIENKEEQEEETGKSQEAEKEKTYDVAEIKRLLKNSKYVKYSNTRFGYSINYPECFKMGEAPSNNDGREFYLGDKISFTVAGGYNAQETNIIEEYQNDEDRVRSSYHFQKNNWYVMSGNLDNDMVFYKKVVWMEVGNDSGVYVTFHIKYPKMFKDALSDFINYVAKNFNPKYDIELAPYV